MNTYPMILVEVPHQRPVAAHSLYTREDLIRLAYHRPSERSSFFGIHRHAGKEELATDRDCAAADLADEIKALPDGSIVEICSGTEGSPSSRYVAAADFTDEVEEQAAADQIADDLHTTYSFVEADFSGDWKKKISSHHQRFAAESAVQAEAESLGWLKCDDEAEE